MWVPLFGDALPPTISVTTEGDPATNICHCVNALSGEFYISEDDLVVPGTEPLRIHRFYTERSGYRNLVPHSRIVRFDASREILGWEPTGAELNYRMVGPHTYKIRPEDFDVGVTNLAGGEIGGRSNLKNQTIFSPVTYNQGITSVYPAILTTPNGTKRRYEYVQKNHGFLTEEELPNGNHIVYTYDNQLSITEIKSQNPSKTVTYAWVKISNSGSDTLIETSDGRRLTYHYNHLIKKCDRLTIYRGSELLYEEQLTFEQDKEDSNRYKGLIASRKFQNNQEMQISYFKHRNPRDIGSIAEIRGKIFATNMYQVNCDKRAAEIRSEIGPNGSLKTLYSFNYHTPESTRIFNGRHNKLKEPNYKYAFGTHVYDAYENTTVFYYSDRYKTLGIEYRKGMGDPLFYQRIHWCAAPPVAKDDKLHYKAESELKSKGFYDNNNKKLIERTFTYDAKCNVISEEVTGDLRGDGVETLSKTTYRYTENNLLAEKIQPAGPKTLYTYLPGKALVRAKLVYDGEKIANREFYTYNADNIIVAVQIDDGSSADLSNMEDVRVCQMSKITPVKEGHGVGLPERIETGYFECKKGFFVPLQSKQMRYNICCQVVEESHYNADGKKLYTLYTDYDTHGRKIRETDPLGRESLYTYDKVGNKIYEKLVSATQKRYTYDMARRLIEESEITSDGTKRVSRYGYNLLSQKIWQIDHFGIRTEYTYNALGRCDSETCENVVIRKEYNWQGKPTLEIDGNGNTTRKTYTAEGRQSSVTYPDGSSESWRYDLMGNVTRHTAQNGAITLCTYDGLGRIITQTIEGVTTKYEYERGLLRRITDPAGNCTTYFYDNAGRKTSENLAEMVTSYTYNAEGKIASSRIEDRIDCKEYNLLGQVVLEKVVVPNGDLLKYARYTYDLYGNKCETILPHLPFEGVVWSAPESVKEWRGKESRTRTVFDSWKRPITITDSEGKVTRFFYDDLKLTATTKEPSGHYKIDHYNKRGKISEVHLYAPNKEEISCEKFTYDGCGNTLSQISVIYKPDGTSHEVITRFEYDAMNRLIKQIEADKKTTTYSYTQTGKRLTIRKPDGVILTSVYDKLDREIRLFSSDGTIDYFTEYDILNRPVKISDKINNKVTERRYDERGNVLYERLGNGLILHKKYDTQNRLTRVKLPDGGTVQYTYDAVHMKAVSRLNDSGKLVYTHTYIGYDLVGRLTIEQHINSCDTTHFHYDLLGRPQILQSNTTTHVLDKFDLRGNLIAHHFRGKAHKYKYDHYKQLIDEGCHSYSYDSHHNRLAKDKTLYSVNELNQLESAEIAFAYTPNGNTHEMGSAGLKYDALDRLIEYENNGVKIHYLYDAFHRRLVETVNGLQKHYLYEGENEIGSYSNGRQELRVLGLSKGAEIGAAVAIEIDGKVFVPLHDLFGNVTHLMDARSNEIVERYEYSAYGEVQVYDRYNNPTQISINPWQFSSKRRDITGLTFFGRRYYDPIHGRWLTPDPLGLDTGPNLYAYLYNAPLLNLDLYGLLFEPPNNPFATPVPFNMPSLDMTSNWMGSYDPFTASLDKDLFGGNVMPNYYRFQNSFVSFNEMYSFHPGDNAFSASNNALYNVFIPGLWNNGSDMADNANYLMNLSGGIPTYLIHNFTCGPLNDFSKPLDTFNTGSNAAIHATVMLINMLYNEHNGNIGINLVAMSYGGTVGKHALNLLAPEVREKIFVINIAPATLIAKSEAGMAYNYFHPWDPVPKTCSRWTQSMNDTPQTGPQFSIHTDHPTKNSPGFFHSFQYKGFQKPLETHITEFKEWAN